MYIYYAHTSQAIKHGAGVMYLPLVQISVSITLPVEYQSIEECKCMLAHTHIHAHTHTHTHTLLLLLLLFSLSTGGRRAVSRRKPGTCIRSQLPFLSQARGLVSRWNTLGWWGLQGAWPSMAVLVTPPSAKLTGPGGAVNSWCRWRGQRTHGSLAEASLVGHCCCEAVLSTGGDPRRSHFQSSGAPSSRVKRTTSARTGCYCGLLQRPRGLLAAILMTSHTHTHTHTHTRTYACLGNGL